MGAPTLWDRGSPTYDFAKFSQKRHEIERIWTPSLASPPLRSANDMHFKLALPTGYKYSFFMLSLNAKIYWFISVHITVGLELYLVCSLPPGMKLAQGYIFTGVCYSVNRGGACSGGLWGCLLWGGVWSQGSLLQGEGLVPWGSGPGGSGHGEDLVPGRCLVKNPLGWPLLRVVRILLECILVLLVIWVFPNLYELINLLN